MKRIFYGLFTALTLWLLVTAGMLAAEKDFPLFSRKICPALMMRWLESHSQGLKQIMVG